MRDAAIAFHLLRPLWLIAIVPVAAIFAMLLWRQNPRAQWGRVIAPHLLQHLIVQPGKGRGISPLYLVAAGMTLGIIALSGPAWRRELPPFVENKAPLMIVLALSSTMDQPDTAPTRLERAKQKIGDLLALRAGARSGLIAYAGTAHLVMPLTDDSSVIGPFLAALATGLMPKDGKDVAGAVALASRFLATEPVAGTILVVSDDFGEEAAIRKAAGRNGVAMLGVAPAKSGEAGLGSDIVRVSVNGSDIQALERRIETRFQAAQGDAFGLQWRDEGYWLLFPMALLALLWFRRGTTVAWAVMLVFALQVAPADAQEQPHRFADIWLTPDQQGRIAFDRGDYTEAAKRFADPMWRGIAAYRALDFLTSAQAFRKVETTEGRFALGNAEAQNHAWEKSMEAYDEVLKAQPGHAAAKTNRAIVAALWEAQEEKRRKQEKDDSAPPDEKADEMRVDPKQKGGKRIQVKPEDVTTAGAAEAWMRAVQTTPADFLKLKFAIQAANSPNAGSRP
jgi:Ca-activated chloride channel family protein